MKKVVLTQRLHEDGMKILEGKVDIVITNTGVPQEMLPELTDADGLIIRIGSIDRETMLAAKNLKVIGRPGVGVDNVDMKAATELGIPVVIAPGANTRSVAEHALALIFACSKDMLNCNNQTKKGNFNVRNTFKAYELYGKTLGLVGCGNIGRELAKMSAAIGMKIAVYDPYVEKASIEKEGYQYESNVENILKQADIISLHVPLTEKTQGLIGKAAFDMMKPNAILINCARGGVVDEAALALALENNKIHSCGLDVLEVEPMKADDPLVKFDNAVVTPHMAGQTKEAASGVATMAAAGVLAVINGEKWPHVANKDAYEHPRWK